MQCLKRQQSAVPLLQTLTELWVWPCSTIASRRQSSIAYEELSAAPETQPAGSPETALVVHGLLGQGRNWRSFARNLARRAAAETGREWRFVLVDQRTHGKSSFLPDLTPPHTMQASAQDLQHLFKATLGGQAPSVVMGHSLGGKVVLEYLKQLAAESSELQLPSQVWVLDSNIGSMESAAASDVDRVMDSIRALPQSVPSRDWLYKRMADQGFSVGLREWLGSSLVPDGLGQLRWAFNLAGASQMYDSYQQMSYWDLVAGPPAGVTLNIVRAEKSDRWPAGVIQKLQQSVDAADDNPEAGSTRSLVLEKAGHWLHVDNPAGLLAMVLPSFKAATVTLDNGSYVGKQSFQ